MSAAGEGAAVRDHLHRVEPSVEPFYLPAGEAGALLIHGWTGTPLQLLPLGHHLHEQGWSVEAIRLPGHGTTLQELHRTPWTAWLETASQAWQAFGRRHHRAALVGYSMGGLLALALAAQSPPRALVGLAVPFRIRIPDWRAPLLPLLKYVLPFADMEENLPQADWAPFMRAYYDRVSTRSLHEAVKLNAHALRLLPQVHVPTLLLHGEQDELVPPQDLERMVQVLPGPVQTATFPRSGHELPIGEERVEVWQRIAAFLERHLGPA